MFIQVAFTDLQGEPIVDLEDAASIIEHVHGWTLADEQDEDLIDIGVWLVDVPNADDAPQLPGLAVLTIKETKS